MNGSYPGFPRRAFLRGAGAAIALPWLSSLLPRAALAGDAPKAPPLRFAFLYVPNGADGPSFSPREAGSEYALPFALEPLAAMKADFLVLSGLAQAKANANGDGPGDHARAGATFLTGCQALKSGIRAGVSVDQVIARHVANETRLPSIEIGCEPGASAGECDSGYSCAYSSNLSWRSETSPMAKEIDPRSVFERLFADDVPGDTAAERKVRAAERKSILDAVLDDARRLAARLGVSDRAKMDEYLTGVREMERRLDRSMGGGGAKAPGGETIGVGPKGDRVVGIPADYEEHVRLMADLLVLAFQADATRVASFMLANEGSNRAYPSIGVTSGHHEVTHHGKDERKVEAVRKINRYHVTQLAYFVERLKATPDGDGTLLDHTVVAYGSCIGDGDRHNHDDLPILVAGRGNGLVHPGRHVRYARGTPLCNLWLSLLDAAGAPADRFGDSTGRLANL